MIVIPTAAKTVTEGPWGTVITQPSLLVKFQASEGPCLQKGWMMLDAKHMRLFSSVHLDTYTHACLPVHRWS